MNKHCVLILGDSLLADGIARMLSSDQHVQVAGIASNAQEALATLARSVVDALIVIGTSGELTSRYLPVLTRYPNLPILHGDVSTTTIHVIIRRSIEARLDQLLAAIELLPLRDSMASDQDLAIQG